MGEGQETVTVGEGQWLSMEDAGPKDVPSSTHQSNRLEKGSWSRSSSSSMYWLRVHTSRQAHITSAAQELSSAVQEACSMHGQTEQSRPWWSGRAQR